MPCHAALLTNRESHASTPPFSKTRRVIQVCSKEAPDCVMRRNKKEKSKKKKKTPNMGLEPMTFR